MKKQLFSFALLAAAWLAGSTARAHDGAHNFNSNGICTKEGCTDKFQPASSDVDGWYLLGNVGNVEWFSAQIAAGNSTYKAKLTADIDYEGLGENYHTPIGNYGKKFFGKFDGQGHSIKNMVLLNPDRSADNGFGFFGCVRLGGDGASLVEIKNLTIESTCSVSVNNNYVGGLIGRISENTSGCTVHIENCINKASVTSTTNGNTGGLIGQINNSGGTDRTIEIINCQNQGAITVATNNAGGLVGQINSVVTLDVTNSTNTGSVTANNYAAGILAQINADAVANITGCTNSGNITTTLLAASGIASQINNKAATLTIESCMNLGSISCNGNQDNSKNAGSIFGANTSSNSNSKIVIKNCGNRGSVSGKTENAALVGWIGGNTGKGHQIENCWNTGEVTGISPASNTMYRGSATVSNIYNTRSDQQGTLIADADVTSGKLCYLLNGDQSTISWWQKLNEDNYPLPFEKVGAIVYQNAEYSCPEITTGDVTYSNTNESTIPDTHVNGICSFCGAFEEPSFVDGYYELTNAGNVEWFSAKVAAGDLTINGKLMNDIDFGNTENIHSPIGPSTGQKYNGTFDGQGYRIKNMIINRPDTDNQGFFGFLRGNNKNTYVMNLIIDRSCSITGKKYVGGIAANGQNNETYIYIQNCVNEADITAMGGDAGGIVGSSTTNYPRWIIQNCVNTGTITATSSAPYAGGASGWIGDNSNSRIENFINIGEIIYVDNNLNIYRGSNIGTSVLVDVSETANKSQGVVEGLSSSDSSSGKLTYYVNNQIGSNVFFQNLTGENVDAYPVPISTGHAVVYIIADLGCDGNPVGTATYSNNNSGATIPPHTLGANGFCSVCGRNPVTSLSSDGDGYLLVSNAAELEFLSSLVNSAGGTLKKVKLTADIDMDGVTHTPIGVDDGNKFCGEFDGQGNRILNMKSFSQDTKVGLFGGLRGAENTTIKNVIIDKSCKITGNRPIGAIAGACQTAITPLYLINCINEADVEGTGWNIAGMIGEVQTDNLEIHITNCGNSGSIKAGDANSCAIFGWARPGNVTIENFWNTGEIIKGTSDHIARDGHTEGQAEAFNFYNANQSVMDAGTIVLTNCYDASASAQRSQGTILNASAATSGELTYKLNGDQSNIVWEQTLGTDEHPVFVGPEVLYVGAAGYTTMYDADNDWELVGDAQAYIGTINGSALHLDEIDDIPAGTAVVISGTYYNKVSTTATATTTGNVLIGSDGSVTGDGSSYYALSTLGGTEPIGFYLVNDGVTIPAGKAYIEYTAQEPSNPVKGFTFLFDDDATSLSSISSPEGKECIYNLAGQRIQKMQRGINIVNGKKIMY